MMMTDEVTGKGPHFQQRFVLACERSKRAQHLVALGLPTARVYSRRYPWYKEFGVGTSQGYTGMWYIPWYLPLHLAWPAARPAPAGHLTKGWLHRLHNCPPGHHLH